MCAYECVCVCVCVCACVCHSERACLVHYFTIPESVEVKNQVYSPKHLVVLLLRAIEYYLFGKTQTQPQPITPTGTPTQPQPSAATQTAPQIQTQTQIPRTFELSLRKCLERVLGSTKLSIHSAVESEVGCVLPKHHTRMHTYGDTHTHRHSRHAPTHNSPTS